MTKVVFGDGQEMVVQSLAESDGIMQIRMLMQTSESLKKIFDDPTATDLMTLYDNTRVVKSYEHFTVRKYIKEETGGIWEVEMRQEAADTDTKIAELQKANEELMAKLASTEEELVNTQLALCEVYESIGV